MRRLVACIVLFGFSLAAYVAFAADVKFGGFGQCWYYYSDAPDPGVSKLMLARMRFKPSLQMTEKVGFFTQFDFRAAPAEIHLLDALLDVKLAPWLKVRAGQFTIPFGIETPVSPFALDLISYSYVVGSGEGTGFFPGLREVGFQLRGAYDPVNYAVAVMNGKGLVVGNSLNPEDNKFRDVAGRVGFSKTGISAGASGYYGFVNATVGYDSLTGTPITDPDSLWKLIRFGADVAVDIANVLLKGEFIMGSQDVTDTSSVNQMGYYATLGYTFPLTDYGPKEEGYMAFQPLVRYDAWDANTDIDDNGISRISAGANFWFDKNAKVSAFYEVRSEEGDTDIKDDRFRLQLALAW